MKNASLLKFVAHNPTRPHPSGFISPTISFPIVNIIMFRIWLFVGLLLIAASSIGQAADAPPNVVLIIADDVSWDEFGCYGASSATPNITSLATKGMCFSNAYLTASSCSPSRSSIITGRYPHNNGKGAELHKPISAHLPWFPRLLREAGYYTAIAGKHHMTSAAPAKGVPPQPTAFDDVIGGRVKGNTGGHGLWKQTILERPKDKPFFFWFASFDAHRGWDGDGQWNTEKYGEKHDPKTIAIPPYLADDAETRQDYASYLNEVTRFDHFVGEVVATLKAEKVYDNTLIFVLADNGSPFPRAKTRLHDSGMRTGLVASWPKGISAANLGKTSDSLVSVIDLAPTILRAAGVTPADSMQGVSLLPLFADPEKKVRNYAFSEHNWHDYEAHGRAVRDGEHLLTRNFRTELAWQGPADSVRSPSHKSLQALRDADKLSPAQADVFLAPRPEYELYDTKRDPLQLNNLIDNPDYAAVQTKLQGVLKTWMDQTRDSVPDKITPDTFHRETGNRLKSPDFTGALTPGEDRRADLSNAPGPR
ncbi:MAG: sulfatase [bacterium]|nr:sulfatase [bacterium]